MKVVYRARAFLAYRFVTKIERSQRKKTFRTLFHNFVTHLIFFSFVCLYIKMLTVFSSWILGQSIPEAIRDYQVPFRTLIRRLETSRENVSRGPRGGEDLIISTGNIIAAKEAVDQVTKGEKEEIVSLSLLHSCG